MKFVKGVVCFLLSLSSGVVFAVPNIVFDLHEQHFSKAIEGGMQGARYDVGLAYVSTNTNYTQGYYTTTNDNGYFNVALKTPIENWSVSYDATYMFAPSFLETRSIKLTADNGNSVVVSFKYGDITFNNVTVGTPNDDGRFTVILEKDGVNLDLYINASKVGSMDASSFSKLKFVDIQLINEQTLNDDLHNLVIGSK